MHYSRDYTNVPVLEPPQLVLVRMPGSSKCGECGADAVATLRASGSGYSMGTDHLHARTCSSISCAHGKLHDEPCEACHAVEEAKQAADAAKPRHLYQNSEVIYCAESLDECWELFEGDMGLERADEEAGDPFVQIPDDKALEVGCDEGRYFSTKLAGEWAKDFARSGHFSGGD